MSVIENGCQTSLPLAQFTRRNHHVLLRLVSSISVLLDLEGLAMLVAYMELEEALDAGFAPIS